MDVRAISAPIDAPGDHVNLLDGLDHPSFRDPAYRARRETIARASRAPTISRIGYTDREDATWRAVLDVLAPLHRAHACTAHIEGSRALGVQIERAPELLDLDPRLRAATRFGLVPSDGLVPARVFFEALANRRMPCTQYLRHWSRPEYTPEPDMIHEVVGHLAVLTDPQIADAAARFARHAAEAPERDLARLEARFWFTLEYGMVLERGELKALGAGLLSSIGELRHAFSTAVTLRQARAREMEATAFDTTRLQPILFVAPSVDALLGCLLEGIGE